MIRAGVVPPLLRVGVGGGIVPDRLLGPPLGPPALSLLSFLSFLPLAAAAVLFRAFFSASDSLSKRRIVTRPRRKGCEGV